MADQRETRTIYKYKLEFEKARVEKELAGAKIMIEHLQEMIRQKDEEIEYWRSIHQSSYEHMISKLREIEQEVYEEARQDASRCDTDKDN